MIRGTGVVMYPSQLHSKGLKDTRPLFNGTVSWNDRAERHENNIAYLLDLIERDGVIVGRKVG